MPSPSGAADATGNPTMNYRCTILLAISMALFRPAPVAAFQEHGAAAQDARAAGAQHGEAVAGAHEEDRPPLLSFDPGTALWSIIVFVVLLIVLSRTAWKPILSGLQQREKFINDSIASARREREEAERLLKQYTEQLEKARQEAAALVEEGKRDADAVRRRIEDEAKKAADEMIARANREIAVARDDAVKALYERTLELATGVAAKIVRRQLTPEDHRALLDESLSEMAKAQG